jgi:DNA topoisomerase-1
MAAAHWPPPARPQLSDDLVAAYLARRALDYLLGFGLSPLLWRKLSGARSAGRVQSVALRLVCEREALVSGRVMWWGGG